MKAGKKTAGAPNWMVTFADMMSLLLALFVLMLSFSTMDVQHYKQLAGSVRDAFGLQYIKRLAGMVEQDGNPMRDHLRDVAPQPVVVQPIPERLSETDTNLPPGAESPNAAYPALLALKRQLGDELDGSLVTIQETDGRIVVSFPVSVAFPSGSAELTTGFLLVLDKLSSVLAQTKGEITIAGHTDSTPIATERFRSNWDLSTARAVSVVHYWLEKASLSAARLTAQGHADSRPLIPDASLTDRAANRRVEISIAAQ